MGKFKRLWKCICARVGGGEGGEAKSSSDSLLVNDWNSLRVWKEGTYIVK